MKRKLFGTLALLLVCTLAAFGFTACGNSDGSDHLHSYVEVVSEEYLKSEATCKNGAVYYKSCSECGIKGKGTFTYGESVAHNYKDGTCIWCGKKENTESRLEEADRLKYTLSEDETYYIVTGIGLETRTAFAVPSTYNGKPVKEIGYKAFYDEYYLRRIEIPAGVTSIGMCAFRGCSSLTSVTFGENSALTSIGDDAFYYCSSLTSVTFGENSALTSIGEWAFYKCGSLTSVTFGENSALTSIGRRAFDGCSSLTSVYYTGSAEDWNKISIGGYNSPLTSATWYYYSESEPSGSGNYWHYDGNGEIVVW